MVKVSKRQSKWVSTSRRANVNKKINEDQRKKRKQSRKMKALGIRPKNLKKDAGIPNICPFKDKIIE